MTNLNLYSCSKCGWTGLLSHDSEHLCPAITTAPEPSADALTDILTQRGARYGKFADQAVIADEINQAMERAPKWWSIAPDQREALRIIANKIGRILNGDPDYDDSWVDIAGYARLIADRLQGVSR